MDQKSQEILKYIRNVSVDGAYKVIDANDIINSLSSPVSAAELSQTIKDLADRDYVLVKFATLSDYCVAPSNKAIIEEERREELARKMLEQTALLKAQSERTEAPPVVSAPPVAKSAPQPEEREERAEKAEKSLSKAAFKKRQKRIFWIAFLGAFSGGLLGAIVNLIIVLTTN